MNPEILRGRLFSLNSIEMEALEDASMPRLVAAGSFSGMPPEELFFQPEQKITFLKHPRYMNAPEHRHNFLEMNYVYAGSCVQTINGAQVTLKQGEFCLLDTNVVHSLEPAGHEDIILNCMMRKNYFDSDLLRRLSGNRLISDFIVNALYKNKEHEQYILFHAPDSPKLRGIMEAMLCEHYEPDVCSDEIISSYMLILFSELLRIYKDNGGLTRNLGAERRLFTDILLYLEQHSAEVTLTSAAAHFGFHPNYLSRLLKKHLGQSFIKIVQDIKLTKACSILENTQLPIAQIVQDAGFSNLNAFYELFQQRYGMTPKKYRTLRQG